MLKFIAQGAPSSPASPSPAVPAEGGGHRGPIRSAKFMGTAADPTQALESAATQAEAWMIEAEWAEIVSINSTIAIASPPYQAVAYVIVWHRALTVA